jgi:hypothetical protein
MSSIYPGISWEITIHLRTHRLEYLIERYIISRGIHNYSVNYFDVELILQNRLFLFHSNSKAIMETDIS